MTVKSLHIDKIQIDKVMNHKETTFYKKKRERTVFRNKGVFYKLWVPNWTQGDITEHCFKSGYYNMNNCSAILNLLHDDSGPRGYIMKEGIPFRHSWSDFCNKTSYDQRYELMKSLLLNSKKAKGVYTDLFPSNMIMFNGNISLIDLDSFNSFSFIFDKKRAPYEKFDLDAWWKPHESICKGFKDYYRQYFSVCLNKQIDFEIDSIESVEAMINLLLRV